MSIKYIDEELISVKSSTLVIKASSLGENTSIKEFAKKHNLDCKTNGKLIVLHEMIENHPSLSSFVTNILTPLGLKDRKDYAFVAEVLTRGVDGGEEFQGFNEEMEATKNLPWLASIVTEEGCFVYKAPKFSGKFPKLLWMAREALLELWNREVKNPGWTSSRGVFLHDLRQAFKIKGVDTSEAAFKEFYKIEGNKLVVCDEPRSEVTISFPTTGNRTFPKVHQVAPDTLDLRIIETVKYIKHKALKSHLFQLNDCNKKVEILAIEDGRVISSSILIGHKGQDFSVLIFGKDFLINSNVYQRIPNNSTITVMK